MGGGRECDGTFYLLFDAWLGQASIVYAWLGVIKLLLMHTKGFGGTLFRVAQIKAQQFFAHLLNSDFSIISISDPINTDWSLTCRYMHILEICCCGSKVAKLSKLMYVEDQIIISFLFLCISLNFLQKAIVQYILSLSFLKVYPFL